MLDFKFSIFQWERGSNLNNSESHGMSKPLSFSSGSIRSDLNSRATLSLLLSKTHTAARSPEFVDHVGGVLN